MIICFNSKAKSNDIWINKGAYKNVTLVHVKSQFHVRLKWTHLLWWLFNARLHLSLLYSRRQSAVDRLILTHETAYSDS
jgi:hypothetical protein